MDDPTVLSYCDTNTAPDNGRDFFLISGPSFLVLFIISKGVILSVQCIK